MSQETFTRAALIQAAKDFLTGSTNIETADGTVNGLPSTTANLVCWENKKFDPGKKKFWASVFYLPNTPAGRTIGQRGRDEMTGILQIDLNIEPDTGDGAFIEWERKARIFFHAGRVFLQAGHSVIVTGCGMSQGRHVENHFRKSITVSFKSHLKRQQVTN